MVVSTVIKNTFGCEFCACTINILALWLIMRTVGMTYWINDMAATKGYIIPFMILLAMDAGLALAGIVFFVYLGKNMRRLTKSAAVHSW